MSARIIMLTLLISMTLLHGCKFEFEMHLTMLHLKLQNISIRTFWTYKVKFKFSKSFIIESFYFFGRFVFF